MNRELSDRLKQARVRAGFGDATAAARRFGWTVPTYLAHENGSRGFDVARAQAYAGAYKVEATWLLTGRGRPSLTEKVPLTGYIGSGGVVYLPKDLGGASAVEAVDLPPGDYTDFGIFKIRGMFYHPAYRDNELVFARKAAASPAELLGQDCVVQTNDGRTFLRTITFATGEGRFILLGFNEAPAVEANLDWAWPVEWTRRGRPS